MFDGEKCIRCWKSYKFEELTAGPQGFSLCERCAAKLNTEGEERRRCPTDNQELSKRMFGIVIVDRCEACGGVRVDAEGQRALTEFIRFAPWTKGLLTEIFFP